MFDLATKYMFDNNANNYRISSPRNSTRGISKSRIFTGQRKGNKTRAQFLHIPSFAREYTACIAPLDLTSTLRFPIARPSLSTQLSLSTQNPNINPPQSRAKKADRGVKPVIYIFHSIPQIEDKGNYELPKGVNYKQRVHIYSLPR